jgi:hypothetical protein
VKNVVNIEAQTDMYIYWGKRMCVNAPKINDRHLVTTTSPVANSEHASFFSSDDKRERFPVQASISRVRDKIQKILDLPK